jgi:hypothetical protein
MAAGYDSVATAIVRGQMKLMGNVAVSLARKVADVTVADTGDTTVAGNGDVAIENIVKEYSSLTGNLGVRMCFDFAKDELQRNPGVNVPSFSALR